jgi:hypothetical protein
LRGLKGEGRRGEEKKGKEMERRGKMIAMLWKVRWTK